MKLDITVADIHIYLHGGQDAVITAKLDAVLALLNQVILKEIQMAGELDALTAEVTRNTEVDQSAITLLNGLAAQIEALKTDPVKLQALADNLRGSSDALASAVVANTPAAP